MADGAAYVNPLLDKVMEINLETGKQLIELGVDVLWAGDDFGTHHGMMISPQMWRSIFKSRIKEIFEELLNELLNNGTGYSFDDEIEIENLLISMFIDIRRYGDEIVEKSPEIVYHYQQELIIKAFLFGIDEVGKTSLVRRIKTGKFNDNFFSPTRKFNIEYIEEQEKGLLAFWDMPGQRNFRKKWLIGLQDSNIIVFMIDIANQLRFEESKKEFWNIVNRDELNGIPLLIMGNKIDLIKSSEKSKENQLEKLKEEL